MAVFPHWRQAFRDADSRAGIYVDQYLFEPKTADAHCTILTNYPRDESPRDLSQ